MRSLGNIKIDTENTWLSLSSESRQLNPSVAMVLESLHAKKRERLQNNIFEEYLQIRKRVDEVKSCKSVSWKENWSGTGTADPSGAPDFTPGF